MASAWIVAIIGAWMVVTPFLGFGPAVNAWINWIAGGLGVIAAFAIAGAKEARGWMVGILAAWLFVAGFIGGLLSGAGVWWNDVLVGALLLLTALTAVDWAQPPEAGTQ